MKFLGNLFLMLLFLAPFLLPVRPKLDYQKLERSHPQIEMESLAIEFEQQMMVARVDTPC